MSGKLPKKCPIMLAKKWPDVAPKYPIVVALAYGAQWYVRVGGLKTFEFLSLIYKKR